MRQTVGALLVIAMVVTPGATAYLLTDRFPRLIAISVAIGTVSSFVGAYISYFLDGATGGVIVVLQTLLFLSASCWRPSTACLPYAAAPPRPCRSPRDGRAALAPGLPVHAAGPGHCRTDRRPTALLSCFPVLKGWSLMGDAVSHAVLPGVVLAYVAGVPPLFGAFAAGIQRGRPPFPPRPRTVSLPRLVREFRGTEPGCLCSGLSLTPSSHGAAGIIMEAPTCCFPNLTPAVGKRSG